MNRKIHRLGLWMLGRLGLGVLFAVVALFLFFQLAENMAEGDTRRVDAGISAWFAARQTPLWHAVMEAISWLAGSTMVVLLTVVVTLGFIRVRRFWPDGATLLLAVAGGQALVSGLKLLFQRERPLDEFAAVPLPFTSVMLPSYSFPSSHSFMAFTLYGLLSYWATRGMGPRRRILVWIGSALFIALVGLSRVFLGAHFPSDVAAGFAVALPWLWGCLALPTAFHKREETGEEPDLVQRLRAARRSLRREMQVYRLIMRHPKTPPAARGLLGVAVAYALSPIDLIPDFLPLIGQLDDVVIIPGLVLLALRLVPRHVIEACRSEVNTDRLTAGEQAE